jgi:predicted enzyme related to lactoylglutathione lyase
VPDPFEALRTAPTPIDPDPAFASRLRARVARTLRPPDQGEPSMTLQTPETTNEVRQGDISYVSLWVPDLERATRFYADVLGWSYPTGQDWWARTVEGQSSPLGLSQLSGTAQYMRSSEGVPLPQTLAPTAYVVFVVDDVDAAVERVRAAGGFGGNAKDQPYGRIAACLDDQGLPFSLQQKVPMQQRPPANGARQGDPAYIVFEVPDAARGRAFYASVLGVRFEPGRGPDGWNLPDIAPMSGLSGGAQRATVVPMFRVDDIQAAVERVRAAGGTATEPVHEGYGIRSECSDDQGLRFYLGQL